MRIVLNDGNAHEVVLETMSTEQERLITGNAVALFGKEIDRAFDLDDELSLINEEDLSYTLIVDGELAGFFCFEPTGNEDMIDYSVYYAITPKFRGLGLVSKSINIISCMERIDTLYAIVHKDNLASMKALKGFVICENQEISWSDLDHREHMKFVKNIKNY